MHLLRPLLPLEPSFVCQVTRTVLIRMTSSAKISSYSFRGTRLLKSPGQANAFRQCRRPFYLGYCPQTAVPSKRPSSLKRPAVAVKRPRLSSGTRTNQQLRVALGKHLLSLCLAFIELSVYCRNAVASNRNRGYRIWKECNRR